MEVINNPQSWPRTERVSVSGVSYLRISRTPYDDDVQGMLHAGNTTHTTEIILEPSFSTNSSSLNSCCYCVVLNQRTTKLHVIINSSSGLSYNLWLFLILFFIFISVVYYTKKRTTVSSYLVNLKMVLLFVYNSQ